MASAAVVDRPAGGGWRLVVLSMAAVAGPVVGLAGVAWLGGHRWAEAVSLSAGWAVPIAVMVAGVTGLALLPTHVSSLACGYVLGVTAGLPAAWAGVVGGAAVGWAIASRLEPEALRRAIERRRLGRRLAAAMLEAGPGRATLAVALARLPPQVPFALGNVLAASLRLPLRPMLIGTAIGMAPRVGLVVWLGAELSAWDPAAAPPMSLFLSLAAAVLGLGGLGVWAGVAMRRPAA
jgi:uncharacterized membrane protein YdjX (TVP38/TMEM64 family)